MPWSQDSAPQSQVSPNFRSSHQASKICPAPQTVRCGFPLYRSLQSCSMSRTNLGFKVQRPPFFKETNSFTPQTWRPSNPQCCTTSSSPLKTAHSLSYSYTPSSGSKLETPSDPHRVRSLFPRPSFWAPTPPLATSVVWAPFSGTSSIP